MRRVVLILDGRRIQASSWSELPPSITRAGAEPMRLQHEQLTEQGGLLGCLGCGHRELYREKDFPRAAGIAIVVVAAALAPLTNYLSLALAALLDFVLYRVCPDATVCYVCRARHRGFHQKPRHPRFDREIDERLRYGEKAVMGKPMRPQGTADAPEPEH